MNIFRFASFILLLCVSMLETLHGGELVKDKTSDTKLWIESIQGHYDLDSDGNVIAIDLRHSWLTDSDLKRLIDFSQLASIDLSYTKVSDEGLEHLKPLANIRNLQLQYAENITDVGISHLKEWKLEQLNLRGTKVTSSLFEHISGMTTLQSLDVAFTRVNDDNFERLGELSRLRILSIQGNKMSGSALPLLKLLPNLWQLNLGGQQRTDSGLWSVNVNDFNVTNIASLAALKHLDLSGSAVTDRGIAQLTQLHDLESLDLSRTKVTAKGIAALESLPSLRQLKLVKCANLGDEGLLACQGFQKLDVLEIQEANVTANGLAKFSPPESLRKLLIGGTAITQEQSNSIIDRLSNCSVTWWPKIDVETGDTR